MIRTDIAIGCLAAHKHRTGLQAPPSKVSIGGGIVRPKDAT